MTNKNRSIISSIKGKLIAAVAMLLVGVFMVISSSYAWFTLSTAPELTGVYTSVGANGNLEMALVPSGGMGSITSNVSDSGKPLLDRNITWGNIVDLGDGNAYGLSQIQLMPARLNVLESTHDDYDYMLNGAGLSVPVYGADGRISGLAAATTGIYNNGSWVAGNGKGVTAIGTASGMSAQQTAWIQYKSNVSSTLAAAQAKADGTFEKYGTPLANVVITRALQGTGASFDISFTGEMITALEEANADLATAAKWYVAAKAAMILFNLDDTTWGNVVSAITAFDVTTLDSNAESITIGTQSVPMDDTLQAVINKYNKIKTTLAATKSAWDTFKANNENDATNATWDQTRAILINTGFLDYEKILVSGKTTDDIQKMMGEDFSMDNIDPDLMNFGMAFLQGGTVDFASGSGVHADFAEVVGEYDADITVTVTFNGSTVAVPVNLGTVVAEAGRINMYAALGTTLPPDNTNEGSTKYITDFYGYMIDLAFRTNAKGSSLMLQTEPIGRIYETNGSEATMGNGSTMTFTTTGVDTKQAKLLMTAVRIVFLDESKNIVAIGLLEQDVNNGDYKISDNEITSSIYLYNFTIPANGGAITIGTKIAATEGKTELMPLAQNTATQLSVLVYLDGDLVNNSMVSAESAASLVGSLNLQFSSSAELKPMDYEDLKGAGAESESTTESESVEETTSNTENN